MSKINITMIESELSYQIAKFINKGRNSSIPPFIKNSINWRIKDKVVFQKDPHTGKVIAILRKGEVSNRV